MEDPRDRSVFINCPFDRKYRRLFHAIVFAVRFCGYEVRCALEEDDSADIRLEKIIGLIKASRYSIHDISRVELDPGTNLPRFNMPLELGTAIGLRSAGDPILADHKILILDEHRYRYQTFVSDLAGVDIRGHRRRIPDAIAATRDFLSTKTHAPVAGPAAIRKAFALFEKTLPGVAKSHQQRPAELTYHDRAIHLRAFLDSFA